MNMLINLYANLSGLWKKVAAWLPMLLGLGSLLSGLGGFANELGHAADAGAMLNLLKGIQTDPNMALVLAGLGALGIHTNHSANAAVIADHTEALIIPTNQTTPPANPQA